MEKNVPSIQEILLYKGNDYIQYKEFDSKTTDWENYIHM